LAIERGELKAWVRPFARAEVDFDGDTLGNHAFVALGDVTVFIVVAHARRGTRGASELLLPSSSRALLAVDDIEALDGVPACVVLAGCRSGRGPARRGDAGSADLGGAFLGRGTACVFVTDEDVPLGPVVELIGTLQRELASGRSPARALFAARKALYERKPGCEALVLMRVLGAADVPLALSTRRAPGQRLAPYWLIGLACAALGALVWRSRRARP
jgi:hypothetical protein